MIANAAVQTGSRSREDPQLVCAPNGYLGASSYDQQAPPLRIPEPAVSTGGGSEDCGSLGDGRGSPTPSPPLIGVVRLPHFTEVAKARTLSRGAGTPNHSAFRMSYEWYILCGDACKRRGRRQRVAEAAAAGAAAVHPTVGRRHISVRCHAVVVTVMAQQPT
eukprot:gene10945-biopygen4966